MSAEQKYFKLGAFVLGAAVCGLLGLLFNGAWTGILGAVIGGVAGVALVSKARQRA